MLGLEISPPPAEHLGMFGIPHPMESLNFIFLQFWEGNKYTPSPPTQRKENLNNLNGVKTDISKSETVPSINYIDVSYIGRQVYGEII